MGGPRKTSGKPTAPRRGTGKVNKNNSHSGSKGKGRFGQKPTGQSKTTQFKGKGKAKDEDILNVFDAEDSDAEDLMKRRDLERVDVRDYEVENIDSEDDEDIDSDDAFNESDAERFGGYKFLNSGKRAAPRDSSDEEDSGEEDSDDEEDDGEMVDLSEMLDASSADEDEEEEPTSKSKAAKAEKAAFAAVPSSGTGSATLLSFKDLAVASLDGDMLADQSESENDSESESESERVFARMASDSDASADQNSDEEDIAADKLSKLSGFVSSISARAPKRRFVAEIGGGFAENENTIGSGVHTKGVSLGINDLLGNFGTAAAGDSDDSEQEEGGEKQSAREIRILKEKVTKLEKAAKKSGSGVVAAPLAKRLQDQMDRKVAYNKTKKDISEWQPVVDTNRAAEHLSFPMVDPAKTNMSSKSLVSDTAGSKSEMEIQIQNILAESGMTDEQQRQYEELELKNVSPEEVRHRQRELRMMRELMFRSEQKAKRMAKIKSKAYRRILKKEKTRAQDKAMEKIKEDDPEMYEMLMEKMAQGRAEERMTLRHKNTSKWCKEMSSRSHGDAETQQAMQDQLDQHDSLKRKIYDIGSEEEISDYEAGEGQADGDASDSDADESFAGIKGRAINKLSAEMAGQADVIPENAPHKALFGMKFMQNAAQRRHEENQRDAQMMRDEFESLEAEVDENGRAISINRSAAAKAAAKGAAKAQGMAPGRMAFGGGVKKHSPEDEQDIDSTETKRVRLNEAGQINQVAAGPGHRVRLAEPVSIGKGSSDASNPWLSEEASAGASQRGGKLNELTKDSNRLDKLSARLRAKRASSGNASSAATIAGEENILLDVTNMLALDRPRQAGEGVDGSDSDSDAGGIKLTHVGGKKKGKRALNPNAFSQRELVEQAFAEDNIVEAEFAAEKDAVMDEDAPKTEDLTLPGWGSWGGTSLQPKKNKIIRKAAPGSGIEKDARKDSKLGAVIINQRTAKSSYKYYSSNVPFPFFTPEQYEETLQAPLGKEWNTTKSHSKMIKPRVMTKAGRIIAPLVIPSKKKQ
ncbi:hypothetical protein GGF37_000789 [Kickxella alabastrina]|nr:hypothetical protein GGF37_000789 [Kickxella alabastrina]